MKDPLKESAPYLHIENDDGPKSLTSSVVARLREDLLSGYFQPGQRLKVEDLKTRYECGASPIREALNQLSVQHLVQKIENRGFRAASLSKVEFDDILLTRTWLEEIGLRQSIRRGDRSWEDRIVLAHHHLMTTPRWFDEARTANPEWELAHKRFHLALVSASGSSFLLGYCEQLYDYSTRYRLASAQATIGKRDVTVEHDAIKDAVLRRSEDEAVSKLTSHYTTTGRYSLGNT